MVRSSLGVLLLTAFALRAQTTQGLIAGQVFDSRTSQPVARASIEYARLDHGIEVETGSGTSDDRGFYAFEFLAPGMYRVRVCIAGCDSLRGKIPSIGDYQPQEIYGLEVFVAARLELNFALRKLSDVWSAGIAKGLYEQTTTAIVHYYAADVAQLKSAYLQLVPYQSSSLDATVSYVVDPATIENLPLEGRDIYTTLVLQPGVTAAGATTVGLGISAAGQRTTSSNFLLDGVENNNYFLTGPLTTISPEAIQEYRVSIANFSAEYGRTAGFLANAVTRSGSNQFHGLVFGYLGNDLLNANSFQNNANGFARAPDKEVHAGYQIGGPILRNRLFFSSEFEQFRSRSRGEPTTVELPVAAFFEAHAPQSRSTQLLAMFPVAAAPLQPATGITDFYAWAPTVSIDQSLGLERFDYVAPGGRDRVMLRVDLARASRPDFVASPYTGLDSRLSEDSTGEAIREVHNLAPNITNELRLGWTNHDLHWNRPHPEIPMLENGPVMLPASELPYAFADRENDFELSDSLAMVRRGHVIAAGGGMLLRRPRTTLSDRQDGEFDFNSAADFLNDSPSVFESALQYNFANPLSTNVVQPDSTRSYSNQQFYFFVQDTWRITPHFSVSAGLRYESFGTLKNTRAQDSYVIGGPGSSGPQQLAGAQIGNPTSLQSSPYHPDRNDWAPRVGISYSLGRTLLHAAYGIYYDRPFDNLFQNTQLNNVSVVPVFSSLQQSFREALSPETILTQNVLTINPPFPSPIVWVDPNLRSPRIQHWFEGIQRELLPNLTLELNQLGAVGHGLVTTDIVNRINSANPNFIFGANSTRADPAIHSDITYLGNEGSSSYEALAAILRYRTRRAQFQVSYTWSHSIDDESDPLQGELLSLGNATISGYQKYALSSFGLTEAFDPQADRGNSDFDQRHNLVFYGLWQLPAAAGKFAWVRALSSNWQASALGGFRSGFPVPVTYGLTPSATGGDIYLNRPNVVPGASANPTPIPGRSAVSQSQGVCSAAQWDPGRSGPQ